ncbi:transcriptional regulator [Streptomyces solincola]|uniref:Transcriptional regulator n=1 Tax=Streptomyces solincola TaxID=2100817 RepID=A0A2S9Q2G9_9ACTN|nr:LCP family protein [Streptomyces solincola]PRH80842.1 transcriptional regulator [Streptomyces solincola]
MTEPEQRTGGGGAAGGTRRHRKPRGTRRKQRGQGGKGVRRWVVVACASVLCLAAAAAVVAALGIGRLNGNLHTVDIESRLGDGRPRSDTQGALNILVLGSDSRAGGNGAWGRDEGGSRSDTAMVLHLDAGRKAARIVSIPRDTLVRRPDAGACAAAPAGRRMMFNSALSTGGPPCAVAAAEQLSGLRMDHFVEVDFQGFVSLVDALGGVEVTAKRAIHDRYSKLDLPAGRHRLGGRQALALVRTRHAVGDGSDLGRIGLQQAFLKALIRSVHASGKLDNPVGAYQIADIVTKSLTTDTALGTVRALKDLADQVKGIDAAHLTAVTLPVRPDEADPDRVVPAEDEAGALWTALRTDRPLPPSLAGRRQGPGAGIVE